MRVNIKIQSATNNAADAVSREAEAREGETLRELAANYAADAPYPIYLGRVNGVDRELNYELRKHDKNGMVEFLDARTHSADLTYQRSLSLIYLKATRDIYEEKGMKGVTARIDNSLNKGFYTKPIRLDGSPIEEISKEDVKAIEKRMKEIVLADIPITQTALSRDEGIEFWSKQGYPEKVGLLESIHDVDYIARFYSIEDYTNFFFGPMVPSTGYIQHFELRSYKRGILMRFPYYSKPDVIPDFVDDKRLHEAFGEERKWLTLLQAPYLNDMNNIVMNGGSKELILLSEALHEKKIADIADKIKKGGKRIVLIAGPSSSGKTTFARRLCVQLRVNGLDPLYMGTDDYFVEREKTPKDENGEFDYENINAIDVKLFNKNMNDLLAGKKVDLPEFNFMTGHKVYGKRIISIKENQPIVIEGIHGLNSKLTEQIDEKEKFKIYISPLVQLNIDVHNRIPSTDARMLRRMVRDYKYRGHTAAMTIDEWPKVRAGEDKNIFPFNSAADVLFNSVLPYELLLLKKYAVPLLEAIKPEEPEYSEAVRMLDLLKYFRVIEEERFVPNNSIVREFIGGSVFVE